MFALDLVCVCHSSLFVPALAFVFACAFASLLFSLAFALVFASIPPVLFLFLLGVACSRLGFCVPLSLCLYDFAYCFACVCFTFALVFACVSLVFAFVFACLCLCFRRLLLVFACVVACVCPCVRLILLAFDSISTYLLLAFAFAFACCLLALASCSLDADQCGHISTLDSEIISNSMRIPQCFFCLIRSLACHFR